MRVGELAGTRGRLVALPGGKHQHMKCSKSTAPKRHAVDPEVTAAAKACFGAAVGAAEWLATPAHGLAGKIPLKVAQTARGRQRVITLLHRIDHNILP